MGQNRGRGVAFSGESLESRRLFAGGTADASFSGDGLAYVESFGVTLNSVASKVDSVGRTVTVGGTSDGKWAVSRFRPDGTLDNDFGPNRDGKVLVKMADGHNTANDLAFQSDGKIVIVGTADYEDQYGVVRLSTNGSLDPTFDGDGRRYFDYGFGSVQSHAKFVAIQSDGKIVVGGETYIGGFLSTASNDMAVARLNTNGSLDSSFDYDGIRSVGLGNEEHATGMAIAADGHIIISGYKTNSGGNVSGPGIIRFNKSGALDADFDTDGKATYFYNSQPVKTVGMVIQNSGKIVITGTLNGKDLIMMRVGTDGKIDKTFGDQGTGWQVTDLGGTDVGHGAMRTTDDGILVSSLSNKNGPTQTAFARYTTDGALDTRFGTGGVARQGSFGAAGRISPVGKRFVMAGGTGLLTARFLDLGANVVSIGTFVPGASETGPTQRAFVVTRSERLPYATQVYFDITGTATKPIYPRARVGEDYNLTYVGFPSITGRPHYQATIPANETFSTVLFTPLDDSIVEPTETAIFTLARDAGYDIGSPGSTTFSIQDNDGVAQTKTLRATADAFVKSGTSANTNFGTSTELQVKNNSAHPGDARQSFLKFDLSSVASVGAATLRFYGKLNNPNQTNVRTEVHTSGVNSWSESGITFNNRPAVRDEAIGQFTVANATTAWYAVDVTAYLRAEKAAGRNTVTLVLTKPNSSDPYAALNSDEAGSNRPELTITA